MNTLPWLILWIPFFIAAFILLFSTKISPKLSGWLATGGIFTSFILSLSLLSGLHGQALETSVVWIAGGVPIEFGLLVNGLSLLMLLIVTGIGSLIFLYSMSYMDHEPGYSRFFASLSLFAFSMLGIVLANNLIQIFIFWELVGLSSYLLIGFYFEKPEAATAGKKAFLTTRVGDVGMMIGILMLVGYLASQNLGTFNFLELEHNLPKAVIPASALTAIALLIFMGVAGKSAQMPLHVWLPDAMEGPTPVSALLHSSTMVVAGIYLLARIHFIFLTSETALLVIAWVGGLTALLAGTIAFAQNDIKKILAYSTLSQLGYMVMALGLKSSEAGMFHLTTHAFFKALLFLGSGSLIHALHTQNIWEMSSSSPLKSMKITSITFLIGTAALMGLPPLSGYFSKEEILAAASTGPKLLFLVSLFVVFCTAFYMGRLCTIVFFRKAPHGHGHHGHEAGWKITVPLMILGVLSVIGAYLPIKSFLTSGHAHHAAPHGGNWLAILSIGLALAGFILSFQLYRNKKSASDEFRGPFRLPQAIFLKKYYFDDFYDKVVIRLQEGIAKSADLFERVVVIETGVNGTARFTRLCGDLMRRFQTGAIQFYAFMFAAGITAILFLIIVVGR